MTEGKSHSMKHESNQTQTQLDWAESDLCNSRRVVEANHLVPSLFIGTNHDMQKQL